MYELTNKFIQQELDDPDIDWTDRQREMFTGMMGYLENVEADFEAGIDGLYNPGLQPEVPIDPEEEPDEQP